MTERDRRKDHNKPERKWGLRRADLILTAVLVAAGIAGTVLPALLSGQDGSAGEGSLVLEVTADGEAYGTYPLSADAVIDVKTREGTNQLVIQDGAACMQKASCRNQICVESGWISRAGQSIICLPNRVTAEIRDRSGRNDGGYDAIVR